MSDEFSRLSAVLVLSRSLRRSAQLSFLRAHRIEKWRTHLPARTASRNTQKGHISCEMLLPFIAFLYSNQAVGATKFIFGVPFDSPKAVQDLRYEFLG